MEIKELSIDIETYSDIDLKKCGVYKYVESDVFDILLFAVSINNGPVTVYDLASGDELPLHLIAAIVDDTILKWAFNASFERICISVWIRKYYPDYFVSYSIEEDTVGNYLSSSSWRCTLVWSAYMGLPLSLEGVGAVLSLDEQKMKEGKDLIRYFCLPCKATKVNGGRTRNLPHHNPNKWSLFKSYNIRDVEVEMSIKQKLSKFPVPIFIWEEYHLDQEINDRGIAIDMKVVENAISFDELSKKEITSSLKKHTGIENPNSVVQMKQWLSDNGIETDTLDKKAVAELLKITSGEMTSILTLRQQLAKNSVKKYQAMQNAICKDGRARGMFMFYGANRTGRWQDELSNYKTYHKTICQI